MNAVTFQFSKRKTGIALVFTGAIFLLPFALYWLLPSFFGIANNSVGDLLLRWGFFGGMSLSGAVLSVALFLKLNTKEPALELSESGIRSNVTELSEKFLPLSDVSQALVTLNYTGYKILHVQIKDGALASHSKQFVNARLFKARPAMRIWYELLDEDAENIADRINHTIENAGNNKAGSNNHSTAKKNNLNKAA